MNYQLFVSTINQQLSEQLGPQLNTNIHTALKNNGKERTGITISEHDTNISPTIYLEEFYVQYCNGRKITEIVNSLVQLYQEVRFKNSWEVEQIHDYNRAKSKIVYKLIHREDNAALLKDIPFIPYLDLAIVFYLILETTEKGTATILITNELQQFWGVSLEELYSTASQNSPLILTVDFKPMRVIIHELLGKVCTDEDMAENRMFVLSNQYRHFGAACILYNRVLEDIGNQLNENFYILPSSIHEVIILPEGFSPCEEDLNEMIIDINQTQVSEEEILSNHAYYYDRTERKLTQKLMSKPIS